MTNLAHPVRPGERIAVLDVLRGFALFGVFLVNLNYVSGPYIGDLGAADTSDRVTWTLIRGLFETKFVTLFSLLFGMGLVLQMTRGEARGVPMWNVYARRLAVLHVLGALHGCFLFEGDILFLYSLTGFVLLVAHRLPAWILTILALLPLLVGIGLSALILPVIEAGQYEPGFFERVIGQVHAAAVTEGPLSLTLSLRIYEFLYLLAVLSILSFNWRVLALFFLGAAAMKSELLAPERRHLHGRVALWSGGLGLGLETLQAVLRGTETAPLWATLAHEVGSLALAFGYAGAVCWLVHAQLLPRLSRWLACVGRMALTNYLTQSVLMNLLLYWFGLNLWGALAQWQYVALVVVLFAVQVVFSVQWMQRFTIGPMEWVWRALTYGERPAWR